MHFSIGSPMFAQRFSSGSPLWEISKVPIHGIRSQSVRCLLLDGPVKHSHRQDQDRRQVTFYGKNEWLPFMGAISTVGRESNIVDGADRYPPMGIDEGSKLWEKPRSCCGASRIHPALSISPICPHGRVPLRWQILCRVSPSTRER